MHSATRDLVREPVSTGRGDRARRPLLLVVGFDGTPSSRAALGRAADFVRGQPGHLTVVYVETPNSIAALSPGLTLLMRQTATATVRALDRDVRELLDDREPRWSFRHVHGHVAGRLSTVADQLVAAQAEGAEAEVVIVVGGSSSLRHHVAGSVGARLARTGRHSHVVIPGG